MTSDIEALSLNVLREESDFFYQKERDRKVFQQKKASSQRSLLHTQEPTLTNWDEELNGLKPIRKPESISVKPTETHPTTAKEPTRKLSFQSFNSMKVSSIVRETRKREKVEVKSKMTIPRAFLKAKNVLETTYRPKTAMTRVALPSHLFCPSDEQFKFFMRLHTSLRPKTPVSRGKQVKDVEKDAPVTFARLDIKPERPSLSGILKGMCSVSPARSENLRNKDKRKSMRQFPVLNIDEMLP